MSEPWHTAAAAAVNGSYTLDTNQALLGCKLQSQQQLLPKLGSS